MSATEKSNQKTNYYKIENFLFVKNVTEKTEKSKTKEYNGKEYFFEEYKDVTGVLKRIYLKDKQSADGSKKWQEISFSLVDENDNKEVITTYFLNDEATEILNRLVYHSPKKKITFKIFKSERTKKDGSKFFVSMVCLYQYKLNKGTGKEEQELLNKAFIFDKENGVFNEVEGVGQMPTKKQTKVKGKIIYDNSEQMEFFTKLVDSLNKLF
jgi:hypothetical protein